jgi:hypothetical protein
MVNPLFSISDAAAIRSSIVAPGRIALVTESTAVGGLEQVCAQALGIPHSKMRWSSRR